MPKKHFRVLNLSDTTEKSWMAMIRPHYAHHYAVTALLYIIFAMNDNNL